MTFGKRCVSIAAGRLGVGLAHNLRRFPYSPRWPGCGATRPAVFMSWGMVVLVVSSVVAHVIAYAGWLCRGLVWRRRADRRREQAGHGIGGRVPGQARRPWASGPGLPLAASSQYKQSPLRADVARPAAAWKSQRRAMARTGGQRRGARPRADGDEPTKGTSVSAGDGPGRVDDAPPLQIVRNQPRCGRKPGVGEERRPQPVAGRAAGGRGARRGRRTPAARCRTTRPRGAEPPSRMGGARDSVALSMELSSSSATTSPPPRWAASRGRKKKACREELRELAASRTQPWGRPRRPSAGSREQRRPGRAARFEYSPLNPGCATGAAPPKSDDPTNQKLSDRSRTSTHVAPSSAGHWPRERWPSAGRRQRR